MHQKGSNQTQATPIHWEGIGTLALKKMMKDSSFTTTQKNPHNTLTHETHQNTQNPTTNHPNTKKLLEPAQDLYLNFTG